MQTVLKPLRSDLRYQGMFTAPAFELLGDPVPVYKSLLKHLGGYGATLGDLKYEGEGVSDTAISCSLLALNTWVWLRLTNVEVNFLKLADLTLDTAAGIFLQALAAFDENRGATTLRHHLVFFSTIASIEGADYATLVRRYINFPAGLGDGVTGAVGFYLPLDASRGEQGAIILDTVTEGPQNISIRVNMSFDAEKLPTSDVPARVQEFIDRQLDRLGLALDRGTASS